MPIYEYACPKCGEFEVTQRITDKALPKCPTCKSKVRKLISSTSFQLKGSGWYATDYAKKTTAKEGTETGKDAGGSGAGDAAKSAGADSKTKDAPAKDSSAAEPAKPSKKDSTSKAA